MYRSIITLCALLVLSAHAYPTTSPAAICGNTALLSGPATAPAGAIIVPAGTNDNVNFRTSGATYWFAPGVHYFAQDRYGQIIPGNGSSFIGGPGAIIDGNHTNAFAFTQQAVGVTIRYLEIRNFGSGPNPSNNDEGVVNHDAGQNWTIEYNYVHDNDGAGVFLGSGSITRFNCLKNNGQYGFSSYHPNGISNVRLENNEISGNNQDDWESLRDGCGCTGGGKWWATTGAVVRNNWVHDNFGPGLWADHNNANFLFENNLIEGNQGMGIFYEVSYNFIIRNNTFRRNSITQGLARQASGNAFPEGAIYISESGGDSRAPGPAQSEISHNLFVNNWDGIVLWENADRFCRPNETFDTTNGCPWFNQTWGERYKTQNIKVHLNEFKFNASEIGCTDLYFCGRQSIFSNWGSYPSNSPYKGTIIQQAITFNQNNKWANNSYTGPWSYLTKSMDNNINYASWRAAPYNQDVGSTYSSPQGTPSPTPTSTGTSTPTPTPTPTPTGTPGHITNHLDADTSTGEGSVGQWSEWYSAIVLQSNVAKTGSKSIQINVTDPWGYGITLANYPGFAATPGAKTISLWAKLVSGTNVALTLTVQWFNSAQSSLQTNTVVLNPIPTTWTYVSSTVTAPAGTAYVLLKLTGPNGAGTSYLLDNIIVGDV
eukprot:gene8152-9574_t